MLNRLSSVSLPALVRNNNSLGSCVFAVWGQCKGIIDGLLASWTFALVAWDGTV
jgi:hypothetical protein